MEIPMFKYRVSIGLVDVPIGTPATGSITVEADYPAAAVKAAYPDMKWGAMIRRAHDGIFVFSGLTHWVEVEKITQ
jgi:hypothetical protein